VTTVKTAPLFSNKTQNGGRISVDSTTSCSYSRSGDKFCSIAPSRGHCISGSRPGVFCSIVFTLILHATPRSSTESPTRLLPLRLPHPRSRAIVSPTSTFQHRQASLLFLTWHRAKVSLQRTLYSATPPGLGDIHLHPPVILRPLGWVFSNTFQHGALD
jgi:hypothetical protein